MLTTATTRRPPGRCLFSAPFEFLGALTDAYQSVIQTAFREMWSREELVPDPALTAWIPNPGQHFLIDEDALRLYPALSIVVTPSTGLTHIDVDACTRRGVSVYSLLDDRATLDQISASAEFTFLLLLNALRRLDVAMDEVSAGRWRRREHELRGHELSGRWVGLVGLGRIGRRLARYCGAFGARVAYYDPYVTVPEYPAWPLEELFSRSDVICVCPRLTPETRGLVSGALLRRMKSGACLVNTARGEVLVEHELAAVLAERPDLRVALDVLTGEATNAHQRSPLLPFHQRGQIVITPHIAGATVESQTTAARGALAILRRHLERSEVQGRLPLPSTEAYA